MIGWFVLEGQSKYEISRDSICSFADGRFQIWSYESDLYAFSDEASQSASDNVILKILKWKVSQDKCFLISKDKCYYVVNFQNGKIITYSSFDCMPQKYAEIFQKMIHWGTYGQFWENFKNENWKIAVLVAFVFVYLIRCVVVIIAK